MADTAPEPAGLRDQPLALGSWITSALRELQATAAADP